MLRVSDIIAPINRLAPPALASDWDNVGLLLGRGETQVQKALITLDVTPAIASWAISQQVQLIISHHPLIFRALKRFTNPMLLDLAQAGCAVFCAHTNLDHTNVGVNQALAQALQLNVTEAITTETGSGRYLLSVWVPDESIDDVLKSATKAGAGLIGDYKSCYSHYQVAAGYTPGPNTSPYSGKPLVPQNVTEQKLELFVDSFSLGKVINAVLAAHPYQQPAYAISKIKNPNPAFGLGLIGTTANPISLQEFTTTVATSLGTPGVDLWLGNKSADSVINRVAICGGSGSSLLGKLQGRAEVFVSADFTYHTRLDSPMPLIDAGHYWTEKPVLKQLQGYLQQELKDELELILPPTGLHEQETKAMHFSV